MKTRTRRKLTHDEFIRLGREIHNDKFTYDRTEFVAMSKKVIITCRDHGDFEQQAYCHLKGQGCRKCADELLSSTQRRTTEEFIRLSRELHNHRYSYDRTVYVGNHDKVIITCHEHGDFEQSASAHLNGQGCPKCVRRMISSSDEFISLAREVHGDKYSYDKTRFTGMRSKVTITCRSHGDFEQVAFSHLNGHECRKCVNESLMGAKITTEEFIKRSVEVHGVKYSYDKTVLSSMNDKVTITCHVHGDFEQRASAHVSGQGCDGCARQSISRRSNIANEWLDSLGISEECREVALKEFPRRPLDAFDAETNTAYQFHGDYWHGNLDVFESSKIHSQLNKTMGELYAATLAWDQQIRDLNYNLVVMWERDWVIQRKQLSAS